MLLFALLLSIVASQSYLNALVGSWQNQLGSVASFQVTTIPSNGLWFNIVGYYSDNTEGYQNTYRLYGHGIYNLPLIFTWNVMWYSVGVPTGLTSWNAYFDLETQETYGIGNLSFVANWLFTFESGGSWNNTLIGQDKFVKFRGA